MAITANFYSFSKRANETKKPTGTSYNVNVLLKEPCDLESPTIEVHDASILAYNYCYLTFTGRYYFIDGRESIALDTYILTLREDYAASHIDEAKGQSVYAVMSSYAFDQYIDDGRVIPVPDITSVREYATNFDIIESPTMSNNCYQFMSVVNDSGRLNGTDIFYGLNGSLAADFLKSCADLAWYENLAQRVGSCSPLDFVNEMWWTPLIPHNCHNTGTNSATLYDVPISGDCLTDAAVKRHTTTITLPKPSFSDFRFSDKYVKYYLEIPYIGVITIPTSLTYGVSQLEVAYAGDCLTGNITVAPKCGKAQLGVYTTTLKAPLPLSRQGSRGTGAVISALVGAAAGSQLGGSIGAAAMGGAGLVRGMLSPADQHVVSSSAGGLSPWGCRDVIGNLAVVMYEYDSNIEPSTFAAVAGRPTEKVITIQNGYLQTRNASVALSGTASEIDAFNALLDGGLYVN